MLSFLSGLLSLGIEVLWVRMFSFAAQSVPQAFSFTLACFLTGIAVGAYFGKRICRSRFVDIPFIGQCFLWAGIADFLILGAAWLLTGFSGFVHHAGIFITLSAVVRGLIFPLVHHVGTDGNKSGRQVSKELLKQRLSRLIWPESGRHVFDSSTVDAAAQKVVSRMLIRMTEPSAGAEVITDDNMIVEYKYGRGI
ncbi:TPA: hypothetical protein ACFI5X_002188 [Neisseria gonorrhoeae]